MSDQINRKMVGGSFNRTPSPMSTRPNPNLNSNPRSNDQKREGVGVRKSFNEYPLSKSSVISQSRSFGHNNPPDNSAESTRRNSFGSKCGGLFRHHEQKENERDPNIKPVARAKSPCIISKGTKDFMTPTISSASKINPSPKKKVLGDRNEAIRTSASLSDGKFQFFSTRSLEYGDETESKTEMERPPCLTTTSFNKAHNEVFSAQPEKTVVATPGEGKKEEPEADLVVLSPEIPVNTTRPSEPLPASEKPKMVAENLENLYVKNTTKPSEPLPASEMPKMVAENIEGLYLKSPAYPSQCTDASLDAPYDPKTNYLSPRPQFLHYKPIRRTEGISLEDGFSSESFSEMESSEEVHSENSESEQEDAVSSVGTSAEVKPPSSENLADIQQLQEIVEAGLGPRTRWFTKWRTVVMLLLFLLSSMSISMTYYPGFRNAVYQDKIFSKMCSDPHAFAELARENLNDLFRQAKLWSARSVGYLIIHNDIEVGKLSPLTFSNSTGWQEDLDYVVNDFEFGPYFVRNEDGSHTGRDKIAEASAEMQNHPESEEESFLEEPEEDESFLEEPEEDESFLKEPVEDESFLKEHVEDESFSEEPELVMPEKQEENYIIEDSAIQDENPAGHDIEQVSLVNAIEIMEEVDNRAETHDTSNVLNEQQGDVVGEEYDISSCVNAQSDVVIEENIITAHEPLDEAALSSVVEIQSTGMEMTETVLESSALQATYGSLVPVAAIASLVAVSLLASRTFKYMKLKKETSLDDQIEAKEKSTYKKVASYMEPSIHSTPSSWSSPVEVDMIGESCPSEMSSFQKTSSYNKSNQRSVDEAQSLQRLSKRNYKRESLASSSDYTMDSSYGSFTTSRIIHPKHGDGEVVTPVRRSSRIRSKITSP